MTRSMGRLLAYVGVTAALAVALTTGATLPVAASSQAVLPPGVIQLHDGEPCPPATLCLYRDYGRNGPAYGIGAGYNVDLHLLPMPGWSGTAANNVSSWVNNTAYIADLLDQTGPPRPLFPHQSIEEPPQFNDTVDYVHWIL